jgi:hypothetical protein
MIFGNVHELALAMYEGARRLKLDQGDIAEACGVSHRSVRRWMDGDLVPRERNHDALLALFAPAGHEVLARLHAGLGRPPPAPPPRPAPPAPSPVVVAPPVRDLVALREKVDLAVYAAAEAIDRSPRKVRAAFAELVGKLGGMGITWGEAAEMVAPKRALSTKGERGRT